jgi:hypothetical protein
MTLPYYDNVICAVCGAKTSVSGLLSTNAMGPSDLDTRPPEMERSTMEYWVQCCSKCGYCADDLSDGKKNSSRLIDTPEYHLTLNEENYPALANHFRCLSLINEADGEYEKAAWASLHGAWVCDDADLMEQSYTCRINAIRFFKEADNQYESSDQEGIVGMVLIDLLRRVGKFEEASREIIKRQRQIDDPALLRILIYQATLVGRHDRSCHVIPENGEDE